MNMNPGHPSSGGAQALGEHVQDTRDKLESLRAVEGDDDETRALKHDTAIQAGLLLAAQLAQLVEGLSGSMKPGVFLESCPAIMGTPRVRVSVDGRLRVIGCPAELAQQLEDFGAGHPVLIDVQETAVVDLSAHQVDMTSLRRCQIVGDRTEDGVFEVRYDGPAEERGFARMAADLEPRLLEEPLEASTPVWVDAVGFIRLIAEADDDTDEVLERWHFPADPNASPANIVGAARLALGKLLLAVEDRLVDGAPSTESAATAHKALLLAGLHGNGKTELVRSLLTALQYRFGEACVGMQLAAPSLVGPYYGESERALRDLMRAADERARRGQLVLVFVEEFDTGTGTRGSLGGMRALEKRMIGEWLALLDGPVKLHANVILVFSTNLARGAIEPALLRRLELIDVPKLGLEALLALLQLRVPADHKSLGTGDWGPFDAPVRAALDTPIGKVLVGRDEVLIPTHAALVGASARAALDRCAERRSWRSRVGLDGPVTPEELGLELIRSATSWIAKASVPEALDYLVEAGLVPDSKRGDVVEPPRVLEGVTEGLEDSPFESQIAELAEALIARYTPPAGGGEASLEDGP